MDKKTTELDFELKSTVSLERYLSANAKEFDDKGFYKLLSTFIIESGKRKSEIAADSCLSEPFLYNLIHAEKRPARDTVIKLSFGLNLSLADTERLLKLAGYREFYVRNKRDSIIKYALENKLNLMDVNELLLTYGYPDGLYSA